MHDISKEVRPVIDKQPKLDIGAIFVGFFMYICYLLFLTLLHIVAIGSTGELSSVLNSTFIIMLNTYYGLLVLGGVLMVIHFLRYLVWQATTPAWIKQKQKGGNVGKR